MPRNVKNFYLTGRIDGRSTAVEGGPQSRDGGFRLAVKQRHEGRIVTALHLDGRANPDGSLVLQVEPGTAVAVKVDGDRLTIETRR